VSMANADRYLVVAGILGIAAYILATEESEAAQSNGGSTVMKGFAINNPGNIRYLSANAFRGQTGNSGGYGVYDTLADGVHAMGEELTKYYNSGLTTVTQVISTWAPSNENDTQAYIQDVSSRMGVDPNEPLSWPQDEVPLIQAIAWHENGYNNMSDADVQSYIA
jgi:hypothetical protein